ncbi:hypothetical protein DACRYDRAFT_112481 [Dacryopinax primogenitus]|uniref:F-box domain-containing protein n=1 Tax=Dacryopinax primogenitus (strain DJM 731) TaxID=1858805 RepID=M5FNZ9_DACPD|nr:uncharacterized protein DACRYDRAFT_112481 [Dacryopinax primogenitus]EJT96673.1 hypothetical protein DACRYDRAFT_112481 [Dacryopinax primogenitus]
MPTSSTDTDLTAVVGSPSPTAAAQGGQERKASSFGTSDTAADLETFTDAAFDVDRMKYERKKRKMCTEKRSVGRSSWLEEMPANIMLEVFSCVEPIDLFKLSYINKNTRAVLITAESKAIWAQARKNVPGLPGLPPDMTEWFYAALLFQQTCQMCGIDAMARSETPFIRMRLCSACTSKHLKLDKTAKEMGLFLTHLLNASAKQQTQKCNEFARRMKELGHDARDLERIDIKQFVREETWDQVLPRIGMIANANRDRRLREQFVARNQSKARAIFVQLYYALPTELEKNSFLPVKDFLTLRSVRSLLASRAPDDEFDTCARSALPHISAESNAFCARMRRDLKADDDAWRS